MATQHASRPAIARIDVNDMFGLVCWAQHFRVSRQHVRQAVQRVGDDAEQVALYLARSVCATVTQVWPRWAI
ncbi:MAG: DUF3606 domain-containing protein [Aquabacterium sp.]|uniref:DUF3606 domain-containing protein n=1 Tax=Aquabacterium sp. TaxID=1872578 RepID=UPI003BB1581E